MGKVRESERRESKWRDSFETGYPVLRQLLRKYLYRRGLLRARAFRMGSGEFGEVLDEATDQAIYVAWKRLDRYDDTKGPLWWWFALHGCKTLSRGLTAWLRNRERTCSLEVVGDLPSSRMLPEIGSVEDRDRLGRALAVLPAEQAQALALVYEFGLSLQELGKVMGRTFDSARGLLQRARENAQRALENEPMRRRGRPRKGGVA